MFKRKDKGKYTTEAYTHKIYSDIMEEHYESDSSNCCTSIVSCTRDSCATAVYNLDFWGNEIVRELPKEKPPTLYDAHGREI